MTHPGFIDIAGQKHGRWTVLHKTGSRRGGGALWLCRCECGTERIVGGKDLRNGGSLSCGCLLSEINSKRSRRHGQSKTRIYSTWLHIRRRCADVTNPHYGGRGIEVCPEWQVFETFRDWAMANGYASNLTIERRDCDLGYSPENCTWIPRQAQSENRRNVKRAPDGMLWSHKAKINGITGGAYRNRLHYGWTFAEAATLPLGSRRSPKG